MNGKKAKKIRKAIREQSLKTQYIRLENGMIMAVGLRANYKYAKNKIDKK